MQLALTNFPFRAPTSTPTSYPEYTTNFGFKSMPKKFTIARGYSWFLCRGIKRNWAIQPTSHTQIHVGQYMPARMRKMEGCGWYCVNADELFCADFKHWSENFFQSKTFDYQGWQRKWFQNKKLSSRSCYWVQHNCCCPTPSCQIQSTVGRHSSPLCFCVCVIFHC